ncbi:hypothetical protein V8D89_002891 [Ganoderma adspersum]
MLPQPQFPPPFLALGDQTDWFQGLVAAISRTIQDDEQNAIAGVIDGKKAEMSAEDEKALIKVLKKWKAGELKMSEVFEELSKKDGRTGPGRFCSPHPVRTNGLTMAAEWKTWFITNFEKLNSKLDLTPNVKRAPEARTHTPGSGGQHASKSCTRTMVSGSKGPSRSSSTTALVNARMYSSQESGSVAEQSSGDTRRSESTSRDRRSDGSPPRSAPQTRCVTKNGNLKTTPIRTRVSSRAGKERVPVTPEDLRAMAWHLFENGDTRQMRQYRSARWREFAERPENRKRTLDAWACIPRLHPGHAAAIERYLNEYQAEAVAARSTKVETSSPGIELPGGDRTEGAKGR